ncbi:DUF559 domain-containing protein [Nostoc favosum]|uniref:DUF559 domain-containing protein n=1 Tax=Nostoc favosum TaxID=2907819 RepID=UPI003F68B6DB
MWVLRQRTINHFIVDFYCPILKVVIGIDGDSHFTDQFFYSSDRLPMLIIQPQNLNIRAKSLKLKEILELKKLDLPDDAWNLPF